MRNELTNSDRFNGLNPDEPAPQPGYDRVYAYDAIGNRTSTTTGDPLDPPNPVTALHTSNQLNQYSVVSAAATETAQGLSYDEDGNLTEMYFAADIDRDGDVDLSDLAALNGPGYGTCAGDPDFNPDADLNGDGCTDPADMAILLGFYGTTIDDEIWAKYTWDAENRLIAVVPAEDDPNNLTAADKKLVFKYDYLNRRVEKLVYAWDPNQGDNGDWATTASLDRRFMYHDRLLLLELDGLDSNARVRKYAWGAGTDGQLGGENSLLAIRDVDADTNYICFNNGSGSVAQLLDRSDGSLDAAYVYDTRGDTVRESGSYAADNPLRYNSWYFDGELDYAGTSCDGLYFVPHLDYYIPCFAHWGTFHPLSVNCVRSDETPIVNHHTDELAYFTEPVAQCVGCESSSHLGYVSNVPVPNPMMATICGAWGVWGPPGPWSVDAAPLPGGGVSCEWCQDRTRSRYCCRTFLWSYTCKWETQTRCVTTVQANPPCGAAPPSDIPPGEWGGDSQEQMEAEPL